MSDLMTVVLAAAAAAGARAGHPTPVFVCGALAAVALLARRHVVLVLAVGLLASGLSARAADGAQPVSAHRFVGWVTLLGDPAPAPGGVKVVVRVEGKHVELWAHGEAARVVRGWLAGERVLVRGVVRSMPETTRIRAARRHVIGRLTADEVLATAPASPVGAAANWVHRTLASGAEVLPARAQALYLGFVVGDRRGVDPQTEARFEAAGLTHLLAVSGESVQ